MESVREFFEAIGDKKVVFTSVDAQGSEGLFACGAFTLTLTHMFMLELAPLRKVADIWSAAYPVASGSDIAETIAEFKLPQRYACSCACSGYYFAICGEPQEACDTYVKVQIAKFR